MDTKILEEQAETYIKSELLKFDFNIIKPSFDRDGTDLLIIDGIKNKYTHFLKIQCKGRTIKENGTSVVIPKKYVQENFVLFIYTIDTNKDNKLFVFFSEDIKKWKVSGNNYSIYLSKASINKKHFKEFNKDIAKLVDDRLQISKIKEYTTLIIDGIFIEKSISRAILKYRNIYPDKTLLRPEINNIIFNIINLYGYYFLKTNNPIHCHIYYYEEYLEKNTDRYTSIFKIEEGINGRVYINKTDGFVWSEIMTHIKRASNSENIILVANDITYKIELDNFMDSNLDIILITQPPSFENYITGNIIYPIGKAMGLETHEILKVS